MADTYRIETLADFVKVPAARRGACLEEFATWIEVAEATAGFFEACGARSEPVAFTWIDDGERNITVSVRQETSDSAIGEDNA